MRPIIASDRLPGRRFFHGVSILLVVVSGCATPGSIPTNQPQDVLRSYRSDEIPRPSGPLNADAAVALALKYNPDIRLLREDVRVAETLRTGAVVIKDPELRVAYENGNQQHDRYVTMPLTSAPWVSYGLDGQPVAGSPDGSAASRRIATDDSADYQFTLRFFPPNPWLVRSQINAADAQVAAAKANLSAMEWNVAMAVRETFARAQYLQDDIGLIDQLIELGRNTISLVRARVEQGTATLPDSVNASKNHLTLINDRSVAERDYSASVQELAALIGIGASDIVITPGTETLPEFDPGTADPGFLENIAVRNRADLSAQILQLRVAESALRMARTETMPWFSFLQCSVGRTTGTSVWHPEAHWTGTDGFNGTLTSPNSEREDSEATDWSIQAGIAIPVFSWLTDPTVAERAECIRRAAEVSATLKRVVAEVRDAVKNLQVASENLSRYSRTSAPDALLLRSILHTAADKGTLTPDDRAKIETALLEVGRATRRLDYEYRLAYHRLTTRVGRNLAFLWGSKPSAVSPAAPDKSPQDLPPAEIRQPEPAAGAVTQPAVPLPASAPEPSATVIEPTPAGAAP